MNKIIIFDFNQTLYDPENEQLFPNTLQILKALKIRGFNLYLISRGSLNRESQINDLNIKEYFQEIIITESKNLETFQQIIEQANADVQNSFVIGDRIKREITFGNICHLKTIWIKRGKFKDELPEQLIEEPSYIVKSLNQILNIIV